MRRLRLAVLISGGGTTLQNFIDLQRQGLLDIDIRLVVSSRDGVRGLERARTAEIPVRVIERKECGPEAFSRQIDEAVAGAQVELVCLGGFLSLWEFAPEFEGRVMNVHPALLPGFGGRGYYGLRVHQAVLAAGCKVSGCTVHFADRQYDHGPIIVQKAVAVREDDTPQSLAKRVRRQERVLYPQAVRLFADDRLRIEGQRVRIL